LSGLTGYSFKIINNIYFFKVSCLWGIEWWCIKSFSLR